MSKLSELWKNVLYFSSILVLTEVLFNIKKYLDKKRQSKEILEKTSDAHAMALFFPDFALCCPFVYREDYHSKPISFTPPEVNCRFRGCKFTHFSTDKQKASSFKRLCKVLTSALKSIDVCLWVFSLESLAKILVHMKSKNVEIRVVIDSREDETEKSQISYLRENGVPVRFAPQMFNGGMFHHKFAIVDSSLLLFGSMNWTMSGIRKNMENICITSRPQLVSPYVHRFQSYWDRFSSEPTNKKRVLPFNNQNFSNK